MPTGVYKRTKKHRKELSIIMKRLWLKPEYKERNTKNWIKKGHRAKRLHPNLIQEIREQHQAGMYNNEIRRLLGINAHTIAKYIKGRR